MRNQKNPGTIVDVRSPMEFMAGHPEEAFNVPLNEVASRLEEFRIMAQPLVLCCASGNRSGQACDYLQAQGINCTNGGSWMDVNVANLQLN